MITAPSIENRYIPSSESNNINFTPITRLCSWGIQFLSNSLRNSINYVRDRAFNSSSESEWEPSWPESTIARESEYATSLEPTLASRYKFTSTSFRQYLAITLFAAILYPEVRDFISDNLRDLDNTMSRDFNGASELDQLDTSGTRDNKTNNHFQEEQPVQFLINVD